MTASFDTAASIEWAVAERPLPGERVSGDFYVVRPFADGVLLAVIDGLGHGPEANHAAHLAADSLSDSAERGVAAAIAECHEALRGSRGVVLTVAVYRPGPGLFEWCGVGNVESILWQHPGEPDGRRESIASRGGVVGYQLPSLHVASVPVAPGDICCLATDGISSGFVEKTPAYLAPRALADHILARFARSTDDALVLAVRFIGSEV